VPEPIFLLLLAAAKITAIQAGHAAAVQGTSAVVTASVTGAGVAHAPVLLTTGVAVRTVLYSICMVLDKLRNAEVLLARQAEQLKEKAKSLDEKGQREMKDDVDALARKWRVD
jgi:hypothetical protein